MELKKSEKSNADVALPVSNPQANSNRSKAKSLRKLRIFTAITGILLCTICILTSPYAWLVRPSTLNKPSLASCRQVPALYPHDQPKELVDMDKYLISEAFRNTSVMKLSGAVQIPTESFDDLGPVGEDKRWEIMFDFAAYLKKTFPRVHESLSLEMINTHAMLFTWKGSDESLKPNLFMAHQDVVPVPKSTVDAWTHPPFSGFYDGKYVWGRGASDCKDQLIGTMEAIEELIKANFKPRRTVLMSFGFDEEISGGHGAAHLAPFILDRYGHNGIASVVDEGARYAKAWGMRMALPGVGEKGYTDVHITIRMPGGHSSIPPDHTSIGVMSELITLIESHPYTTHLDDANPYLGLLTCGAEHAPNFPSKIKKLLRQRVKQSHGCKSKRDHLALEVAKEGAGTRYLMQTSVAADLISGGVKINALPERTTAVINHRINIGEQSSDVHKKITRLAKGIADKYNLTLHAFDDHKESPSSITLDAGPHTLEPAPVSPTDASINSPWTVLSGTTRALYGEDVVVTPGLMTGNTDTKYYWNLTKHIFRYSAGWDEEEEGMGNIHTVDERISVKGHVNTVRWTSMFVRNMDAAHLDS